jgi:hypothetical protein
MSTIILRASKGSPLTNTEVDSNFTNLNSDKLESSWTGNTTLVTLGTVTTGTWNATAIGATYGGTGQSSYTVGDLVYASSTTALSKLAIGTAGQVLTTSVGGLPAWQSLASLDVGQADSLHGGTTGSLPYQSAANTTAFLALGTNGYILTAGSGGPVYSAPSSVSVGSATSATTATNIAGGSAGSVPYNTGTGTTTLLNIGTINYVMTSSGTAPQWSASIGIGSGGTGATTVSAAQTNLQVDPAGTAVAMAIALG